MQSEKIRTVARQNLSGTAEDSSLSTSSRSAGLPAAGGPIQTLFGEGSL